MLIHWTQNFACSAMAFAIGTSCPVAAEPLEFNRDIRPILSDKCFQCHGPDPKARKGNLRLDNEENVKQDREGYAVVAPGASAKSELIKRLLSTDPDQVMPPPELGRS